jgi:hypothetical protein
MASTVACGSMAVFVTILSAYDEELHDAPVVSVHSVHSTPVSAAESMESAARCVADGVRCSVRVARIVCIFNADRNGSGCATPLHADVVHDQDLAVVQTYAFILHADGSVSHAPRAVSTNLYFQ